MTRTWAAHGDNDFAHLIKDVNDEQLALIKYHEGRTSYIDYHIQFHRRIAKCCKHQLVTDMSEEAMVENDLTGPFMPHGLAIRWVCRCMMSLALCGMAPVPIWRRPSNTRICAAPVLSSRGWC